jgi:hypothetical protein
MHVPSPRWQRRCATALTIALASVIVTPAADAQFGRKKDAKPFIVNGDGETPKLDDLFDAGGKGDSPKKIVIGSFTVEFATWHGAGAKDEDGAGKSVSQQLELFLKGVDSTHMQAITDSAYAAFVSAAGKAGFEVVSKDALLASAVYQAGKSAGKASGEKKEPANLRLVSYAPTGMVINGLGMAPGASDYVPKPSVLGGLGALKTVTSVIGDTRAAVNSMKALEGLPAELGGASVVQIRLALFFADLTAKRGKAFSNTLTASVGAQIGLFVDHMNTQFAVTSPNFKDTRTYDVKQSLFFDGAPFTEVEKDVNVAANVALAVVSGGRSRMSRRNVIADPAAYVSVANAGLGKTAELMFTAIKSLK